MAARRFSIGASLASPLQFAPPRADRGYMIFTSFPDKKAAAQIAGYVSIMSDVFLRLIKMLIGPLVFSTLVVGIAHMGDASSVGRVFAKALGWFITASLVSLVLGLLMSNLLRPGE